MHIDLTLDSTALSAQRAAARRTPWLPLLSALMELSQGEGELVRHAERAWASVTFSGTRHTVVLSFTGSEAVTAGERWMDLLPEHEFAISGQLVADAAIVAADHTALPEPRLIVTAELLLLEDQ